MIENRIQLKNTKRKLDRLEALYESEKTRDESYARDATLRSLRRFINQLKEEIAVFETHHPTAT